MPLSLARRIVAANHSTVTVAHSGRGRTLDNLCLRFYWPGMRAHVEDYVRNCHECQRLKPRHELKTSFGEVMEPTRPWELVVMDICGPFPITVNNNRYLLTFIDHLTKYTEAVPLKTMTAEECPAHMWQASLLDTEQVPNCSVIKVEILLLHFFETFARS